VLDPLPARLAGATWTCVAAPGSSCAGAGAGSIDDTAVITAGGHVTYHVTGTVAPAAAGPLINVAQVTPPAGLLDPGCDPNCLGTAVVPGQARVDLTVAKASATRQYTRGHRLSYTVTVGNHGPSTAVGVRVSDPLPAALTGAAFTWTCEASHASACTPSGTGGIADIVTVTADGTLTYTITGIVPPAARGTITETVTVTPPPFASDNACEPVCSATDREGPAPQPRPEPRPRPHPKLPLIPVTG
jgi:uncharacterized repeat protein (TIGR01451 family)